MVVAAMLAELEAVSGMLVELEAATSMLAKLAAVVGGTRTISEHTWM